MSSFQMKAKHNVTGEIHNIWCRDDYFGKHEYGYVPEDGEPLTEDQFSETYTPVEQS